MTFLKVRWAPARHWLSNKKLIGCDKYWHEDEDVHRHLAVEPVAERVRSAFAHVAMKVTEEKEQSIHDD